MKHSSSILGAAHCMEKIIDEVAKTAAVWFVEAYAGASKQQSFKYREAVRYSFDEDGKITSYHAIYDTYWLHRDGAVSLSATNQLKLPQSAAIALFGTFVIVAAIFVKRREQHGYALLTD